MGEISSRLLTSQPGQSNSQKQKIAMIVHMLVVTTIVIFGVETLIMEFLNHILNVHDHIALFLDGLLLVAFLFPLNYFFVVRPMANHIEENHAANQELARSYEVLERFFSIDDVMFAYLDADFQFVRVNRAYAQADGHDPEFYIGKNHFDLFPNEENRQIFAHVVQTGQSFSVLEKPFEYANNPERGVSYWDWTLMPIKDSNGKVIELLFALTDVTARKQAQLDLADSERRFRAIFNQTFQHMGLLDPSGQMQMLNQTALDFTGLPQEAFTGKPLWEIECWDHTPGSAERLRADVRQAAGGTTARGEYRVVTADGNSAVVDTTIKPLLNGSGEPVQLIFEGRDITRRKIAEDNLIRSDQQIRRLYQAEKHAHEMAETLRSAALALSGSLDSDTVVNNLLDHLYKVAPYTSAHVTLLDSDDHLVFHLARGEEQWEEDDRLLGRHFPTSDLPVIEPILKQQQTLFVPDTILYPGLEMMPGDAHVRSWFGIPLLAGERVIGACMLEHECPGYFTSDQLQWASALVSQATVAIQNAWLFGQVRDGREHLQALSRRLVEVQESERQHIARELHDEAGQLLASMMVGLKLLERASGDPAAVIDHCRQLRDMADCVLEDLHRLAVNLRPALLDHFGLLAALRQHAENISDKHGLAIQFEVIGQVERMSIETETAIYRIVQETLTNIVRHARATRVDILLDRRPTTLLVVVEDNGVGFRPQDTPLNHLGVIGMRERADVLGGTLTIESTPGAGTTIALEVPLPCPSES